MTIKKLLLFVVATALVSLLGGISAGRYLSSTSDAVVSEKRGLISSIVEQKVVSSSLYFDGQIARPLEFSVNSPVSTSADEAQIITEINASKNGVSNCELLFAVNNRPVFVVQGNLPSYRSLKKGDSGADVTQLQNSLKRCGFEIGSFENGKLGEQTFSAIEEMYGRAGYSLAYFNGAIPFGEIISVSQMPVFLNTSLAHGANLQNVSVFAQAGAESLTARAPLETGVDLKVGDSIIVQSSGVEDFQAVIKSLQTAMSDDGAYLRIELDTDKDLNDLLTPVFRAEYVVRTTNKEVIAVPGSALWIGPDSNYFVTTLNADGTTVEHSIEVGLCGNGWCEILNPELLKPGTKVVVGLDTTSGPSDSGSSLFS